MVGAQISITPPVRGAAPGAARGSALNLRTGRRQSAVVAGVKVRAESERPPGVPVGAGRPLVVRATDPWCQQVISDKIFIQLHVLIFSVASQLAVVRLRHASRGRMPSVRAGFPRRDRDGHRLTCLAAEPALFPAK